MHIVGLQNQSKHPHIRRIQELKKGFGLRPVASATGRIGYATCVQSMHIVGLQNQSKHLHIRRIQELKKGFGLCPVALATGQKPCP